MSEIRFAEIGHPTEPVRLQCLSDFLKQNGHVNVYHPISVEPEHFSEALEKALKENDFIRISMPYGEQVAANFTHLPAIMMMLKNCDCLIKRDSNWWPENLLYQALQVVLAGEQYELDLSSAVLIAGSGASARTSVAALLRMGFNKINITARSAEKGRKFVAELGRNYFNVHFQFTEADRLTSLSGIHSLVINTTPCTEDNALLKQLYYFNFMQASGLVIDFTLFPLQIPLEKETIDVGGRFISGAHLASFVDQLWVEQHLGFQFDRAAYEAMLRQRLQQYNES